MAANYDQMLKELKKQIKMSAGPIGEGKKDNRNSLKTGSVKSWNTYPGDVYIEPEADDEKDFGTISYHFSGRERVADYVAGAQRDTNDHQSSGKIVGTYEFTRRGTVYFDDLEKSGGRGRVGNAVVRHLQHFDGTNLFGEDD